MQCIVYGGVRYNQIRHAVYCTNCGITIESTYQYDCQYCVCGTVGIDGGTSPGNRLLGDLTKMETRSIYVAIVKGKRIWLPKDRIEAKFSQLALN
jgi:hypothetical protein